MKPLAIELFAGTGSGTAGWVEAGGRAVCFDLQYLPHHGVAPAGSHRVIQDVLTLHGSQFKNAAWIWASPPCQSYSYLAMPWSRSTDPENSKAAKALRKKWETEGPDNRLFDACFRIQREAITARAKWLNCDCAWRYRAGFEGLDPRAQNCKCYIPLIVENVRGAVPWVGKRDMPLDQWNALTKEERAAMGKPDAEFGSFKLFGDVACIGNRVVAGRELADIRAGRGRFGMGVAPEKAVKLGGGLSWSDYGKPDYKPFGFNTENERKLAVKVPGQIHGKEYAMCRTGADGQKTLGHVNKRDGHSHTRHLTNQAESDAVRNSPEIPDSSAKSAKENGGWFNDYKKDGGGCVGISRTGSKSNARKAASALIAKIPPALSDYVARVHLPTDL